jgi:TolB-like protein/Tfp pilus assembly protein PilF
MSLIAELKRRNVFRVGVAYAIVAWILVEMASVVLPALRLPEWTLTLLVFLVIAGFPLALIVAWAFELTPEGIKREAEVDRTESITHVTGRKLDFAIIGLLVVAVVFLVVDNYVLETEPEQAEVAAEQAPGPESVVREKSIAVLPFENQSQDASNEPFTIGIHDDILTQISKIRALKVISRTSVMEYRNTTKNLKTIGQELGVATVLEGGVQRAGDRVRINVQLIDAATDEHLWADTYDRQLTAANIFAIQTEIATAIADALRATLSPEEQDRLAIVPTENLDAYEAYLLGKQRLARRTTSAFAQAVDYFQRAIRLDPAFALAYVGLAETYILQDFYSGLPHEETIAKARAAAEQALKLNDQLGEAYTALAAVKEDAQDYEGAEAAYKRALELNPNYPLSLHWYGWMLRSSLGRPEEALQLHRRASELDPLSGVMALNVAGDLESLGRFDEAEHWYDKTMELTPNYPDLYTAIGDLRWSAYGRPDEALVAFTKALSLDPGNIGSLLTLGFAYLNLGDLSRAEQWIRRANDLGPESVGPNIAMQLLELYRGNEAGALEHARKAIMGDQYSGFSRAFLRDHALRAGRSAEARMLYEKDFPELLSGESPTVDRSNYPEAIGLALVLSRAGEQQRADLLLDRSLRQIQLLPRFGSAGYGIADVQAHAIRGERRKALAALRMAIDEGWSSFWWYFLEHDMSLESLHDEPEFQAMVAEIEADMAAQLARVREMERNGELEPIPELVVE